MAQAGARVAGRKKQLQDLAAVLDDALAGRRRLVLVEAEAGLGKTALVTAFAEGLAPRATLAWGHAWESGGAPPFWPWIQVLRAAAAETGASNLTTEQERPWLACLLPELGPASQTLDALSEAAPFLLFDAVNSAIGRAARTAPLVVILEDLHVADPSTLFLTEFVARHQDGAPLLVIATVRPAALALRTDLSTTVTQLHRHAALRMLLPPLEAEEIAELVVLHGGGPMGSEVVDEIHRRSEGNPLFALELARTVRSRPGQEGVAPADLPRSVRESVLATLAGMRAGDVDVLTTAAVVGRRFSPAVLGDVCGAGVEVALRAGIERGLVVSDGADAAFAHALVRDAIYDSIDPQRRAAVHRDVAAAIERLHADDLDPHLAELAHHSLLAPDDVRRTKGVVHAVAAGARARRLLAYDEAGAQYLRALEVADAAGATRAERCDLLVAAGEALARAGDSVRAREALAEAFQLAEDLGSFDHMARAAEWFAGQAVIGGGSDEQAVDLLERAMAHAPAEPSRHKALVLGRLAHELSMSDDVPRARVLSHEALDVARSTGSTRALAETELWVFPALFTPDQSALTRAIASEMLDAALQLGDPELELRARAYRTNCLVEQGRRNELRAEGTKLASLADRVPVPFLRWIADLAPFEAHVLGELERFAALADRALQAAADVPDAFAAYLLQQLSLSWDRGELATLAPTIRAAGASRPAGRWFAGAILAAALAQGGEIEQATAEVRTLTEEVARLPLRVLTLPEVHWLSEAAVLVHDTKSARLLYDALLPYAGRHLWMPVHRPVAYWGTTSRHLGNLAAVLGRATEAVAHLREAVELHTRFDARLYLATSQFELAQLVDGDERRTLLAAASQSANALGLAFLRRRIDQVDRTPTATPATARVTLVREGDAWTLAADGRTVRLRHSKGIAQLAQLLARPGVEIHAVELDGCGSSRGDGSPLLDERAKHAYRRRVEELRADIEEADAYADIGRAALAREELDALTAELSRAVGLGGRDRRTGPADQARINVTKLLKGVIRRIGSTHPDLSRHLSATVRTGTYCSYDADAGERRVHWEVRTD